MRFHAIARWMTLSALPALLIVAGGCTQSRTFTIYAKPADARLIIDGVQRGPGPITQRFEFTGPNDVHRVSAAAPGFETRGEDLWSDTPHDTVVIQLRPAGKRVIFTVGPVPAVVKVNGTPVDPGPVDKAEYTIDASTPGAEYVVTAEREGYEPARRTLRGSDPAGYYPLVMRPAGGDAVAGSAGGGVMRPVGPERQPPRDANPSSAQARPESPFKRDIVVHTDPPDAGATIFIDGEEWGRNGVDLPGHEFKRDASGKPIAQKVTATAPGFEGGAVAMRWEDNRAEYVVPLGRRKKAIQIFTDPAGAVVTLDGRPLPRDRTGAAAATVTFPPTDPPDRPTAYTAHVAATSDAWEPQDVTIAWDDGRPDYRVKLSPVRTSKVVLLRPGLVWTESVGWRVEARRTDSVAVRDPSEGTNRPAATRFAAVPADTVPDSLAVSPDGSRLLCTLLAASADGSLGSSLRLFNADGTPGEALPGEGRFVDLTPSFTPDGARIFFASDRGGRGGINAWSMPSSPGRAAGAANVKQVSSSANATLWPTEDSNPQPRLFYEAVLKGAAGQEAEGSEVRVFDMAAAPRTNMTLSPGTHPRPSPRADSVIFTVADPVTGNRDLYMVSDKDGVPLGGQPVNLTNTPDVDECDPAWSRNGVRIAFASNAAADEAGRKNYDVYVMNVSGNDRRQTRVTYNGSWDDCPAWDPGGKALYFRSNRGGQWAIWKIEVP